MHPASCNFFIAGLSISRVLSFSFLNRVFKYKVTLTPLSRASNKSLSKSFTGLLPFVPRLIEYIDITIDSLAPSKSLITAGSYARSDISLTRAGRKSSWEYKGGVIRTGAKQAMRTTIRIRYLRFIGGFWGRPYYSPLLLHSKTQTCSRL